MEGLEQERRGVFGGVKPPFDLGALLLAFFAIALFQFGVKWGIEPLTSQPHILERIVRKIDIPYVSGMSEKVVGADKWTAVEERIAKVNEQRLAANQRRLRVTELDPIVYALVGVWGLVIWAFFGGAIGRIMAMKIARDEGLELREAWRFGSKKFISNLMSVVTIGVAIGFLYLVCNSLFAGVVGSIPWIGEILLIPILMLVFLSSIIIILLFVPLVLGNTLMSSAIATESSDSFDGMSRAFSYVYSRPWQVLLFHFLAIAYIVVFLFFASLFLDVSLGSLRTWGVGLTQAKLGVIQSFVDERSSWSQVWVDPELFELGTESSWGGYIFDVNHPELKPLVESIKADPKPQWIPGAAVATPIRIAGVMIWLLFWIAKMFIIAFVLAYWFSANQAMYFILRRDVDGEDPSEIYIEEEEEDQPFEVTTPDMPAAPLGAVAAVTSAEARPYAPGAPEPEPEPKPKSAARPKASTRGKTSTKTSGAKSAKKSTRASGSRAKSTRKSGSASKKTGTGTSQRAKKSTRGKKG